MTDFRVAPLEGQSVVITGGTSGIGLATACSLARAGAAHLILVGRDAKRGMAAIKTVAAAGPQTEVRFRQGDVADPDTAHGIAEAIRSGPDRLDSIVTCAGGGHAPRPFHELSEGEAESILGDWLLGTIHVLRALIPILHRGGGGSIVTVASDAAKLATPGEAVIGAAMAGIVMLTRTIAIEEARTGIRANCLTPSLVDGTLTYNRMMSDPFAARVFGKAVDRAHLGITTPEDQARMILFLLGPDSRRMTGQAISINGGISAS